MPDTPKTPGQVAYAAWWHARYPRLDNPLALQAFRLLPVQEQRAWDAAAQAVLAWQASAPGHTGTAQQDTSPAARRRSR